MQGRKVIPINIKKAKGTYQACRDRKVPLPSPKKPIPPTRLNKRAKQIFHLYVKRLSIYNLDSRTFTEAIAYGAEAAEKDERFGKILEAQGALYATLDSQGQKVVRVRPEVKMQDEARKEAWKFLIEFGLTGTSAQKMGTMKSGKKRNEFEGF
mgnify:CR=1 FL=1